MKKTLTAVASSCVLALVGCSAAQDGSTGASGETAVEQAGARAETAAAEQVETAPFQTVQAGLEQVSFYDNGDGSLLLGSSKPNALPGFAVDVLEETAGIELTPLEIFRALAPTATPDPRLVADHEAQVIALGRADASVVKVAFAPRTVIEKAWTPAQCDTGLGFTTVVVNRQNSKTSIDTCTSITPGYPTGSCDVWVETSKHRSGVCNNSSTATFITNMYTRHIDSGWAHTNATVQRNGSWLWTAKPRLNDDLTGWQKSKMRLTATAASGSTFHARLAPY